MSLKIKDIPLSDRPRERLINGNVEALNNDELLAIILSSGTKKYSAKTLANILLREVGSLKKLSTLTYNQLIAIEGIGPAKACSLLATIELGRRVHSEVDHLINLKFNNSKLIYQYYKDKIGNKKQEHFYCLYLDNANKIIAERLLFIGTINQSLVHPREIFKEAYLTSATSIICIHNHPSGNLKPSINDIKLTTKIVEASKILGIRVIDHLIISRDGYYSFFENNQI